MLVNKLFVFCLFVSGIYASDDGSLLFHGNCVTCHHKTKAISAPSMIEIQKHYKEAFSEKEDFVNYMSNFVIKPKKEKSIMLYAIDKYALMPELAFDKDSLKEISSYIYRTNFNYD